MNASNIRQARLAVAPSTFKFSQHGKSGAWVSELLPWTAKIVDDIAIVSGLIEPSPGNHAVVVAISLPGSDAQQFVDKAIRFLLPDVAQPRTAPESLAGTPVLRLTDAADPGAYPRNVILDGDTVWVIEADDPLRTQIAAAIL